MVIADRAETVATVAGMAVATAIAARVATNAVRAATGTIADRAAKGAAIAAPVVTVKVAKADATKVPLRNSLLRS